jgi:uncharacterized membrane protein YbhN (UPF0104 family)
MLMIGKLSGAFLLSLVLWFSVDWVSALAVLIEADRASVAAALVATMASVLLSARKWQHLLRCGARLRIAYNAAAQLYWIGSFFSNFLPTGIGGDAMRLMLTPAPDGRLTIAASILAERLTGLLVMLALSAVALLALPLHLGADLSRLACVAGMVGAALLVLAVLYLPAWFLACLVVFELILPPIAREPLNLAQRVVGELIGRGGNRRAITVAIFYSFPFYGAVMLAQYWMLISVGAEVGPITVMLAAPLVSLVALTPITVNGWFLAEGAFVVIYASAGVPPDVALAAAIVRRLVDLANSGFGGAMWLAWHLGVRSGSVASAHTQGAGRGRLAAAHG